MQQLAHRLERLGTETAFSVAQAAAAWKAKGNLVYPPFHLGDINIPPTAPPHIVEAMTKAIADGYTGYCPPGPPGIPPQLREALAEDIGSRRGISSPPPTTSWS